MSRRGNLKACAPTLDGERASLTQTDSSQPIPPPAGFTWEYPPTFRVIGGELAMFLSPEAKRVSATWLRRSVEVAGVREQDTTKTDTSKLANIPNSKTA